MMRLCCLLFVLIPAIADLTIPTKYYSIKAQIYCATRSYTGEAKMWILREKDDSFPINPEKPSVLKVLPIIDGFLNVTVEDKQYESIRSYYLTIDAHDHTCCPQSVAQYKSFPYMAETFNYHDDRELAQLHPYDLDGIELIKYCPGAHKGSTYTS